MYWTRLYDHANLVQYIKLPYNHDHDNLVQYIKLPYNYDHDNLVQYIKLQVCQWLVAGRWFSSVTPVSTTNKTDRHDIT
jgi:hypothetical protein